MRNRGKRITALMLALTMLAGDASLAYAAEEPAAAGEQAEGQEDAEQDPEAEEEAGEDTEPSASQDGQEATQQPAQGQEEPQEEQPAQEETRSQTEPPAEAEGAETPETAEAVQMADAVSGEYTYTTSGVNATITGYTGTASSLVIPEELDGYIVQEIGDSAFAGNLTLTSVEIPSSVETIEDWAFDGCVNLASVALAEGVERLGDGFLRGTAVTELTLPRTVTDAYYALGGAQNLTKGRPDVQILQRGSGIETVGSDPAG